MHPLKSQNDPFRKILLIYEIKETFPNEKLCQAFTMERKSLAGARFSVKFLLLSTKYTSTLPTGENVTSRKVTPVSSFHSHVQKAIAGDRKVAQHLTIATQVGTLKNILHVFT